jgi:hypothetical protein
MMVGVGGDSGSSGNDPSAVAAAKDEVRMSLLSAGVKHCKS